MALEKAARKSFAYNSNRSKRTTRGIHQVDSNTLVTSQLDALTKRFDKLQTKLKKAHVRCMTCGDSYMTSECPQRVLVIGYIDYI